MNTQQTALVAGATGLVGKQLVNTLLADNRFGEVIVFTRRKTGFIHPKLTEHLIDFDKPQSWAERVKGDVLFSCLGTTLKAAGSKEKQYRVDFSYQYELAKAASTNKVGVLILVSSAGADPNSRIFYSRMKGELDEAVQQLNFKKTVILRPSILDGNRQPKRPTEAFSLSLARVLTRFVMKKYRPVADKTVARAMVNSVFSESKKTIFELDEIFALAGE
ncbi:MAG: NAD(P)H-binding protein [Mangrovibacterium sp.]